MDKEPEQLEPMQLSVHTPGGNCWAEDIVYSCTLCGVGELCDVCHKHDEPRGDCSECEACPVCED